jgi:hypothetical protein
MNALATALASATVLSTCDPMTRVVASLLYAVHPIKTEAVAGIVGMAEVISALFCFGAFYAARKQQPIVSVLLCFLASMAKETGVTACLVLTMYYVRFKRNVPAAFLVPAATFTLFFAVRLYLFGRDYTFRPIVQDNPMVGETGLMWLVNVVVIQAKYVQLVVLPWTLLCDYAFDVLPLAKSVSEAQVVDRVLTAMASSC